MAYREITMIEIKEVLRRWVSGTPKKRLAAQLGLDPKTVRRYVKTAEQCGVRAEDGLAGLTDELVGVVIIALKQPAAHPHGDPWWACEAERSFIEAHLKDGLRLTKILRLLVRRGVQVPFSTLHRVAVQELGFGRTVASGACCRRASADREPLHNATLASLQPDGRVHDEPATPDRPRPTGSRFRFPPLLRARARFDVPPRPPRSDSASEYLSPRMSRQ